MTSFLVVYGSRHGQTATVADCVGNAIADRGHEATVRHGFDATDVELEAFDAVLVGSPVVDRRQLPEVVAFVGRNREALTARPSGFFQVSLASVRQSRGARERADEFADQLVERTGWRPDRVGLFAGAVDCPEYGRLTRPIFRLLSAVWTGDTDTAGAYEDTDWDDVESFAAEFARFVETRAAVDEPTGAAAAARSADRRRRTLFTLLTAGVLVVAYHRLVRPWHLTWGATDEEVDRRLPGDERVPDPGSETTRAVTVRAPSDGVWPWIAQLGQGRGGFYSYSWLENLAGADIHNVDHIVPELQDIEEGETVRLAREDYWVETPVTSMTVERVDPGRTLVLEGHDGGTWTFHLEPVDGEATRLLVRGRAPRDQSPLGSAARYLGYELPHFVMERGMMRGIKARAERDSPVRKSGQASTA